MRPLLLLSLLTAPASAQNPVLWANGDGPGDRLGSRVAACGDVDDDGYPDWIVGAPKADANGPNSGSALVFSGLSGALLYRFDGDSAGIEFGSAVDGAGDVNGDGHDDLIIGAPRKSVGTLSSGEVIVFSGADGSVLHTISGAHQFGFLGSAVAGAGDVDGDTRDDFIIATPYADTNGTDSGEVAVYSGATGLLIRAHSGDTFGAHFGSSLDGGVDVNGDGRTDYLVGAPADDLNGDDAGQAKLFSGLDGTALGFQLGTLGDQLGQAVAFVGDLDGNGRSEYGWGAPGAGGGNGEVYVRLDTDVPLFHLAGTELEALGSSLGAAGDLHANGARAVLIGAPLAAGGGRTLLRDAVGAALGDLPLPADASAFGTSVAGGFDTNGDGRDEVLIGDPGDDEAGSDTGRATLYSTTPLAGELICDGVQGPCPCANQAGTGEGCMNSTSAGAALETTGTASVALDGMQFHATQMPGGTPAVLFTGTNAIAGGVGQAFKDGLLCTSGASLRMGVRFADAAGAAQWGPGLAAEGDFAAGSVRFFQVWYRDAGVSVCGTGSNTSSAVRVSFSE